MGNEARSAVGRAAARGAFAMAVRQVLVSAVSIGGSILLARILSPSDYGVYAVVTFCVGLFALVSDLGLGASLVRQSENPDPRDMGAIFSFQQISIAIFIVGIWIASPFIARAYSLQADQVWLIRVLVLNLLFSTFQSFPNVLLERQLKFSVLARIEITQVLSYNLVAVLLAWKGLGAWAFVMGTLLRSVVGTSQSMIAARWIPQWNLDWKRLGGRLRFGVYYQGASTLSWIKDSIVPTLVGLLAGTQAVGYIGWAGGISVWAVLALQPLNRVYFPVFSRLQHDIPGLTDAFERVIAWVNRIVAPVAIGVVAVAPVLTHVVYTDKWIPALRLLYLLSIANAFAAASGPCMSLLNALGKPQWNLSITAIWMGVTWIVGGIAIPFLGAEGFGVANIVTAITSIGLWVAVHRLVPYRFFSQSLPPWLLGAVPGIPVAWWIRNGAPNDMVGLVTGITLIAIPYLALSYAFYGKQIRRDLAYIRSRH